MLKHDLRLMLNPYRRFRFQFSLRTLILAITLAALLVGLWTTSREVRQARIELAKYRRDVGYLEISDPNKACARAVRTAGSMNWEWRIYLPEERSFRLRVLSKDIPEKGIPEGGRGTSTSLPSGEYLLKAVFQKNLLSGWAFSVSVPGKGESFGVGKEDTGWIGRLATTWSSGVGEETVSVDPGAPLELLRLRVPASPRNRGLARLPTSRTTLSPARGCWCGLRRSRSGRGRRRFFRGVCSPADLPRRAGRL